MERDRLQVYVHRWRWTIRKSLRSQELSGSDKVLVKMKSFFIHRWRSGPPIISTSTFSLLKWVISHLSVKTYTRIVWLSPPTRQLFFHRGQAKQLRNYRAQVHTRKFPTLNSTLLLPATRCRQKRRLVVSDAITLDCSQGPNFDYIWHHWSRCRNSRGNYWTGRNIQ